MSTWRLDVALRSCKMCADHWHASKMRAAHGVILLRLLRLCCAVLFLCCAVPAAWTGVDEDAEDVQLWGDNWDDDDAHYDDFANQLREELKKGAQKAAGEGTGTQDSAARAGHQ